MQCKQCNQTVPQSLVHCPHCGYPANADYLSQGEKDADLISDYQTNQANPYQSPSSVSNDEYVSQYKLWNPNAAALWGMLFSPIFSAYLQMRNWQNLGNHQEARQSQIWIVITIIAIIGLAFLPEDVPALNFSGLVLLLAWYTLHGKKQIVFVEKELNNRYIKKSWGIPILVAIGVIIVFIMIVGILITYIDGI